MDEVVALGSGSRVEVEYNRCNWKVKTVTAYYGGLVKGSSSATAVDHGQQSTTVHTVLVTIFSTRSFAVRPAEDC